MRKFVLIVKYGTGQAAMIVDSPDIQLAIAAFKKKYMEGMPETKEFGMPEIVGAEVLPIMYDSIYEK